jgi:hypothetical protein
LTVLLLFAQCKIHYWKLVTWLHLTKKIGTTKMCTLTICFRVIPWLLSDSSKPWSYGMCSVCRGPKTQKWLRWLALHGCPFGGQDNLNKKFSWISGPTWTSATYRTSFCVNCISRSRDNVLQPNPWDKSLTGLLERGRNINLSCKRSIRPCNCNNSMVSMNCVSTKRYSEPHCGDWHNSCIISWFSRFSTSQNNRANGKWQN